MTTKGGNMNEVAVMTKEQKALVEYKLTPKEITELVNGYLKLKVVPDDPKSYQQAHEARMVCVKTRTGIDKRRKELGEDARQWVNAVNKTAKDLTTLIEPAESHLTQELGVEDGRRAEVKAEKARKEAERVQGIRSRIEAIRNTPLSVLGKTSQEIRAVIQKVLDTELTADVFQEFLAEAESVKEKIVSDLVIAADSAAKREQEDSERKAEAERLEAIRKQQAEEAARLEALRKAEEEKARKEREALDAERRKIESERAAIEAQKKAEADRVAREAWEKKTAEEAKAKAEKEAAEKVERDAREAKEREEKEKEEKARLEALRPDKEKLVDWFFRVENVPKPDLSSDEAKAILSNAIRSIDKAFIAAKKSIMELK